MQACAKVQFVRVSKLPKRIEITVELGFAKTLYIYLQTLNILKVIRCYSALGHITRLARRSTCLSLRLSRTGSEVGNKNSKNWRERSPWEDYQVCQF